MFPTEQDKIDQAIADGICAKVYNQPIYLSQIDRAGVRKALPHRSQTREGPRQRIQASCAGPPWMKSSTKIYCVSRSRLTGMKFQLAMPRSIAELQRFEKKFKSK